MINNPKDIKELINTLEKVPEQVIKKAIKEVIQKDKERINVNRNRKK